MEKWKISLESSSTTSGMDMSQISELATVMMDTWVPASGTDLLAATSGGQPDAAGGKTIFVKEELSDFPGVIPIHGFMQGPVNPSEQMPMDDFDPLESFSFWDGENFYCHDTCTPGSSDMQVETSMPPLVECIDDMTRDNDFAFEIKDESIGFLHNNPTLAELNSCGESIFDYGSNFNFMAEENSLNLMADALSKPFPVFDNNFVASPASSSSIPNSSFSSGLNYIPSNFVEIKQEPAMSSSCPIPSRLLAGGNPRHFLGPCDEKLPVCPQNSPASDSFFTSRLQAQFQMDSASPVHSSPSPGLSSPLRTPQRSRLQQELSGGLLSSSAPPDMTFAARVRSERPSSHSPRSVTERSLSGFSSLSLSNDDESACFFDDEDEEEEFSSDDDVYQYESDDLLSAGSPTGKDEKSCRKHRFFWQYNLQSRGTKTQNILRRDSTDPHILNDAFDPVFAEDCVLPVKHSGKARRGDGNDLTPDPRKLFSIGVELKKLNRLIYNVNPSDGSPGKPLSRKEKNKLASRVCRLKKKAQHEANKIKLYGLQQEHKKLLSILIETKEVLKYKIENLHDTKISNCSKKLETFFANNVPYRVAGNTTSFVNEVLDKISKGEPDGGLGRL